VSGMHIAYDLSFTPTEGRWARDGSWIGLDFPDVRMYLELAQTAERAGVDLLFFGDGSGVPSTWRGSIAPAVEWGIQWPRHDMSPVIAAMSTVTAHIGDAGAVADALESNFASTGARGGYMLASPLGMPSGLAEISELLLPEFRRRGALAPRYPGRTLRENLAV
jgi:hypothetical protein